MYGCHQLECLIGGPSDEQKPSWIKPSFGFDSLQNIPEKLKNMNQKEVEDLFQKVVERWSRIEKIITLLPKEMSHRFKIEHVISQKKKRRKRAKK